MEAFWLRRVFEGRAKMGGYFEFFLFLTFCHRFFEDFFCDEVKQG